ncbi:MAG: hypothetical protein GX548_03180 [Lentisphaerae bacterium]|nr:hypothetical protein [Lentisphaerota bacterium]
MSENPINDDQIECLLETRFRQLAGGWKGVSAPTALRALIQSALKSEFAPVRSRAREFLDQLARNRDLLADILADPARLLPVCLNRLKIPVAEFAAELERLRKECAGGESRELSDEEAAGVVAAGPSTGLTGFEIHQLQHAVNAFI